MIIYLDTETTGLYPGQICQLSYIMQSNEWVKAKNMFFTVDSVDYGAFLVHGFSVEKLKKLSGGKRFIDKIDEIENDFLSADVIVAHNFEFDSMFLRQEFLRVGKVFTYNKEFCSMKKMTPVCKLPRSRGIGYKYPKLNEMCTYFHITDIEISKETEKLFLCESGYHDARFDTTALYMSVNTGIVDGELVELKEYL